MPKSLRVWLALFGCLVAVPVVVARAASVAPSAPFPAPLEGADVAASSVDGSTILAYRSRILWVAAGDGSNPHPLGTGADAAGVSADGGTIGWVLSGKVYVGDPTGAVRATFQGSEATVTAGGAVLVRQGAKIHWLPAGETTLRPLRAVGASLDSFKARRVPNVTHEQLEHLLPGPMTWTFCASSAHGARDIVSPVGFGIIDGERGTLRYVRSAGRYVFDVGGCVANASGTAVVVDATRDAGHLWGKSYLIAYYHGVLRELRLPNAPERNGYSLARISPNGRYALMTDGNPNPPSLPLALVDLAAGRVHLFARVHADESYWSPDSSAVAFLAHTNTARQAVGVITTGPRSIHFFRSTLAFWGFTANGRRLLFDRRRAGGQGEYELISRPRGGGAGLVLTLLDGSPGTWRYSPDGGRVWFLADGPNTWVLDGQDFGSAPLALAP